MPECLFRHLGLLYLLTCKWVIWSVPSVLLMALTELFNKFRITCWSCDSLPSMQRSVGMALLNVHWILLGNVAVSSSTVSDISLNTFIGFNTKASIREKERIWTWISSSRFLLPPQQPLVSVCQICCEPAHNNKLVFGSNGHIYLIAWKVLPAQQIWDWFQHMKQNTKEVVSGWMSGQFCDTIHSIVHRTTGLR